MSLLLPPCCTSAAQSAIFPQACARAAPLSHMCFPVTLRQFCAIHVQAAECTAAGNYNITAEFSGSLNGIYQPSAGSTTFTIRIDSLPVQWGVASAT